MHQLFWYKRFHKITKTAPYIIHIIKQVRSFSDRYVRANSGNLDVRPSGAVYIDSTIPVLSKSKHLKTQPIFCGCTVSCHELCARLGQKTNFLMMWLIYEPCCDKTSLQGFLTRSDTNRAVQPQKVARGLKFLKNEVEGLYY